jgi:hypothetical protein
MKYNILYVFIFFTFYNISAQNTTNPHHEKVTDSIRVDELNEFWQKISTTVKEGNFKSYSSHYHPDAVLVHINKEIVPINKVLKLWKEDFIRTKEGQIDSSVSFRFSERSGNETTAFEKGIFCYTTVESSGKINDQFAFFEAILIKKNNQWQMLVEHQKSLATKEDWETLR